MMYNPFSLTGKTIFVTGASSGIGKAIAIECSKMGACLMITGRNEERLNETFCRLEGDGHSKIIADLSVEKDVTNVIDSLSSIDGVVHSAGIFGRIPFQYVSKTTLFEQFELNFNAPVVISQQLIKKKILKNGGVILFITSISGIVSSYAGGSIYSATKGALNGLIKGMAIDLAPKKIRVNSVMPAMIKTNIIHDEKLTEEQWIEDEKKYPLKRYGRPEEVAFAAIYLLSDAAAWITGTNLLIDGGRTITY